ncbi:MAG: hypothetical protein KatS3mg005_3282 [Bryobacteraceae bacterium]|nr:MAG: hypothetical protein KatS3mg005_3282 [Bryobacteraceae bacterium]
MLLPAVLSAGQPAPSKLAITGVTLHYRQEDGPPISANYEYHSGELLYLSFRIAGFRVVKDRVDLRWSLYATDPEGRLLEPAAGGAIQEELSYEDRNWLPRVQYTMALPGQLPPGGYRIRIRVADELAQTSAEHDVPFRVGGRPLPKVDGLTVLNLGFYRDEADREPMPDAVYRPGETLIARFQVAGFTLGGNNRFSVSYGLEVLNTQGDVLFTQEEAASDEGEPFYPRRLLNGMLTLSVSEGVQPGDYQLAVTVVDKVGGKTAEARGRFRVEK